MIWSKKLHLTSCFLVTPLLQSEVAHILRLVLLRDTFLIDGMGLSHASTASGIIWTMPVGDRVRLIIPPVVQHAAICHCQKKVSGPATP